MTEGLLIVLSGPSGVGKGTVCRCLHDQKPELKVSVSMTTRLPRPGEVEGRDYYFTTQAHFESLIESSAFLEWAKVHGQYYGTPRNTVLAELSSGCDLLLEIDVQGARQVREKFPQAVLIFLAPPSREALEERIGRRGTETTDRIEARLATARREMLLYSEYDYLVVNDQVEQATGQIEAIITAEKCKVSRGARPNNWEVT